MIRIAIFLAVLFAATQIADSCISDEKYKHEDCVSRKNTEHKK